jgi:hypothetical protein
MKTYYHNSIYLQCVFIIMFIYTEDKHTFPTVLLSHVNCISLYRRRYTYNQIYVYVLI